MTNNNSRGEIVTLLTIGAFLVIGVSSLVSSLFLKNNQPINTFAQDRSQRYCNLNKSDPKCAPTCTRCDGLTCNYHSELEPNCQDTGCITDNDCKDNTTPPVAPNCLGKVTSTYACDPACCDPKIPSSYTGQNCVVPNGYCLSGFSTAPTKRVKQACMSNQCAWTYCSDSDPNCCDVADIGDTSNISDQNLKKCSTCSTNEQCVGVNPTPQPQGFGSCFNLTADVEQKPITNGVSFNITLNINNKSNKGGDVFMTPPSGNIRKNPVWANSTFQYYPEWTDSPISVSYGKSTSASYKVKFDACGDMGNENTLTCLFQVDNVGNPYSSCGLKNPPAVISGSIPPGRTNLTGTPNPACSAKDGTDANQCKGVTTANCDWYSNCNVCRESGTKNDVACPKLPCSAWNTPGSCGNTINCVFLNGICGPINAKVTTPTCTDCYGILKGSISKKGDYAQYTRDTVSIYILKGNQQVKTIPNVTTDSWSWTASGTNKTDGPQIGGSYIVIGKLFQPGGGLRAEKTITVTASNENADLIFDSGGATGDLTFTVKGLIRNTNPTAITDWANIKIYEDLGGINQTNQTPVKINDKIASFELVLKADSSVYNVLKPKCSLSIKNGDYEIKSPFDADCKPGVKTDINYVDINYDPAKITPPASATVIPIPPGTTAKCEDPSAPNPVICPSSYNEADAAGNLRWVVRNCPGPDQGGFCQYSCFDSTKTKIIPCWSDQQIPTIQNKDRSLIVVVNNSNKEITVKKIEGTATKVFGQGTNFITSNETNIKISAGSFKTFTLLPPFWFNDPDIPASMSVRYTNDQGEALKGPFQAKWYQITIVQVP